MKALEALKAVLSEQISGYRALLDLLQRERMCLVGLNAVELEQLTKEKDTILLKLRLFEEERGRLTRECGSRAGLGGDFRLKDLAESTGDQELLSLRSQLLSLLQGIGELNDLNRTFTERALGFTRGAIERLRPASGAGPCRHRSAVLSREV